MAIYDEQIDFLIHWFDVFSSQFEFFIDLNWKHGTSEWTVELWKFEFAFSSSKISNKT